ncbi:hypothetical protein Hanom_Chr14g01295111 [Helianthus anomalus]
MACFGATSLGMISVFSFLSNFVFFVCFGSNRLEGWSLWVWSTKNVAMGIFGYDCSGCGLEVKICRLGAA